MKRQIGESKRQEENLRRMAGEESKGSQSGDAESNQRSQWKEYARNPAHAMGSNQPCNAEDHPAEDKHQQKRKVMF